MIITVANDKRRLQFESALRSWLLDERLQSDAGEHNEMIGFALNAAVSEHLYLLDALTVLFVQVFAAVTAIPVPQLLTN